MDVSDAIDLLFGGVVPERLGELRGLWGQNAERVRLTTSNGFLLQQLWGTIQVNEIALRQIWLTGYAAEQALNAYLAALTLAAAGDEEFDAEGWHLDPSQAREDAAFDALFDKVVELGKALGVDDIAWPQGIPKPAPGLRITDRQRKATFDLVCIAGAWMFAHEVRHQIYECQENAPDIRFAEEVECDRWALRLLLDDAGTCAKENHWNPELVRAKRLWGILIAMLTILSVTPRPNWGEGTHPAIADRLTMVLDAACDPLPNWFWAVVASILAGFARRLNLLQIPLTLTQGFRQVSYELVSLMRP
jgi:hypothetical protein